jgi:hypothetical protein
LPAATRRARITLTTPYVAVPAVLRQRCGLHAGDRALLAAILDEDTLTIYPLAVLDHALRVYRQRGDHP